MQSRQLAVVAGAVALATIGAVVAYQTYFSGSIDGSPPKTSESAAEDGPSGNTVAANLSDTADKYKLAGNDLFNKQDYAGAIEQYTAAITVCSSTSPAKPITDLPKYYGNRAAAYFKLKQYEEVIGDCDLALRCDPGYVKAYVRKAQALENLKRYNEAAMAFGIACTLETDTKNVPAYQEKINNIFTLLAMDFSGDEFKSKRGKFLADNIVLKFVQSFPRFEQTLSDGRIAQIMSSECVEDAQLRGAALYNKAIGELYGGNYKQAFGTLKEAMEHASMKTDPSANCVMGMLAHLSCDMVLARDCLLSCVLSENSGTAASPDVLMSAYLLIGNALLVSMDPEAGELNLKKAESIQPNSFYPQYHLAEFGLQAGQMKEAVQYYKQAIKLNAKHIDSITHCALAYAALGDNDSAKLYLDKAIKLDPHNEEPYLHYALIYQNMGDHANALTYFDSAIAKNPKSALAYASKGYLILSSESDGAVEAAEQLFIKAIAADPECIGAYCNLALVRLHQNKCEEALALYDLAIKYSSFEPDIQTLYILKMRTDLQIKVNAFIQAHFPAQQQ